MSTPNQTSLSPSLSEAIASASQKRLAEILRQICSTNVEANAAATSYLLVSVDAASGVKRKAYETCENCKAEFHVMNNKDGDCVYHDGEIDVDDESSVWDDYDDYNPDPSSSEVMNDPGFKEGYIMSCCEKRPYEKGCVKSKHEAKDQPRKQQLKVGYVVS
ncbi:Hypothetical protein R9X50_00662900 [Acrodontium crateriforme]|uniref:C2H2-type domain-containing protein n=1 Tax=Acrodontium crateriforme TaxID=150365 RepID=A0AAQ3MBY7_9PEZI|nr:Hypothetical protein R9X50_00662900 [Acrodontium crateriforme]